MTDPSTLALYQAQIAQAQGRIAAMQAENDVRKSQGLAPAYGEKEIMYEVHTIDYVVDCLSHIAHNG